MANPFRIRGPAVISFSGGRTSAFMLHEIAQAGLDDDVHVMFANTGKEREETLIFVKRCADAWGLKIEWLEYMRQYIPKYKSGAMSARMRAIRKIAAQDGRTYEYPRGRKERGFREVSFETAARFGEPFDNMIDLNGLPNRSLRMCTSEMKIRVIKKRMLEHKHDYWDVVLGLRSDEPRRVTNKRAPTKERWDHLLPLADAGVVVRDVMNFWSKQPFDLGLEQHEGNCDDCFMKSVRNKQRLVKARPQSADWWLRGEERTGSKFRPNEPSLRELIHLPILGDVASDDEIDCACTD